MNKKKKVFWKELLLREVAIVKSDAPTEIYSGKGVSVYPSPPEGFLINDYDNKIGKEIDEKIPVKFWERINDAPGILARNEKEEEWEVKLKRGWFRDYLEVYPPKKFESENVIMFSCWPPVEVNLEGFNRYFYCGWFPTFLAILGGVGYWVYKRTRKTKNGKEINNN